MLHGTLALSSRRAWWPSRIPPRSRSAGVGAVPDQDGVAARDAPTQPKHRRGLVAARHPGRSRRFARFREFSGRGAGVFWETEQQRS